VTTYAYDIKYRAFGAVKSMTFGDHQSLSTSYDNRMRPTSVNVSNVLGYSYSYYEHTNRVNLAQSLTIQRWIVVMNTIKWPRWALLVREQKRERRLASMDSRGDRWMARIRISTIMTSSAT
jgi:hypothetical protein